MEKLQTLNGNYLFFHQKQRKDVYLDFDTTLQLMTMIHSVQMQVLTEISKYLDIKNLIDSRVLIGI